MEKFSRHSQNPKPFEKKNSAKKKSTEGGLLPHALQREESRSGRDVQLRQRRRGPVELPPREVS
jgi:hypothetical protein